MAGCCGGKRRQKILPSKQKYDVMGGYGYLQAHQIRARLEVYKRKYCTSCEKRFECDFAMYEQCQKYRLDK